MVTMGGYNMDNKYMTEYQKLKELRWATQTVLPTVYDDSLSFMELLNKVVKYLNVMMKNLDNWNAFLQEFMEKYDSRMEKVLRMILEEMIANGRFEVFLSKALLQVDEVEKRLNIKLDDTRKELEDYVKAQGDKIDKDFITLKEDLLKQISSNLDEIKKFKDEAGDLILNAGYKKNYSVYKDKDISDVLNGEVAGTTIFLPVGTYYIEKPVQLQPYVSIEGAGDSTKIIFRNTGMIDLNFSTTLENLYLTVDSTKQWGDEVSLIRMKSETLALDSKDGVVYYQQMANIRIRKINAYKPFKKWDNSKFMYLQGKSVNDSLSGFWDLVAEDVIVNGFSYSLMLDVTSGWLNANTFFNWRAINFEYAVYLKGSKNSSDDNRIGANKFDTWTIQPTDNRVEKIFYKTEDFKFSNDFVNIDIWDIMRYKLKPSQIGNCEIRSFTNNYTPKSHFYNHYVYSNVLFANRIYPLGTTEDTDVAATIHMTYFESDTANMEIIVRDKEVTFFMSRFMSKGRFKIVRDNDYTYYLVVGGSPATGTLSIHGSKNLIRQPLYFLYDTDISWPMIDLEETIFLKTEEVDSSFNAINGHTGMVTVKQQGSIVYVDMDIDSTNSDSTIVGKLPAPLSPISFGNEVSISGQGYLNHTSSVKIRYMFSYIRQL